MTQSPPTMLYSEMTKEELERVLRQDSIGEADRAAAGAALADRIKEDLLKSTNAPPRRPVPPVPERPPEPTREVQPVGIGDARPATEPSIGGAYAHAWSILKADFWTLLLIGVVAWLLGGAIPAAIEGQNVGQSAFSLVYQALVGTPLAFGTAYVWLRAVRGVRPQLSDLFVPFQRAYVSSVLAGLLTEIVLTVGFILLIVPGVILAVRLCFVPFLVVNERQGPIEALQESWNRTRDYGWTLFGGGVLAMLILIVGVLLLIIGVIPAAILNLLALASLYAAIAARQVVPTSAHS